MLRNMIGSRLVSSLVAFCSGVKIIGAVHCYAYFL